MNKYLFGAAVGVLILIGLSYAHATVFSTLPPENKFGHQYVLPNNDDSCYTPEEIAGLRQGKFELINSYSTEEDVLKVKQGVIKLFPDTTMDDMKWVRIDVYKFVDVDGKEYVLTSLFYKVGDDICNQGGGKGPLDDWNKIVEAAGLNLKAENFHPGFEPKVK